MILGSDVQGGDGPKGGPARSGRDQPPRPRRRVIGGSQPQVGKYQREWSDCVLILPMLAGKSCGTGTIRTITFCRSGSGTGTIGYSAERA